MKLALSATLLAVVFFTETLAQECPEIMCAMECPFGFRRDANGCHICECQERTCQAVTCGKGKICKEFNLTSSHTAIARCVDPKLVAECQQPMDMGMCKAAHVRWFYDTDTDMCLEFTYGGCEGNTNNFQTMLDCDMKCKPGKFGNCSPIMCTMYCEEYEKDENGCDRCRCVPPTGDKMEPPVDKSFSVKAGCDEEGEVECDLHCPYGFARDDNGCQVCECNYPSSCENVQCSTNCPNGRHVDSSGCPTCQCRGAGECSPVVCTMYCQFGNKKDQNGCIRCACEENPCSTTVCPDGTYCELLNSTSVLTPTCLMETSWSSDCSQVSCRKQCDYGYKSDRLGCPVCECLTEPKPDCSKRKQCRRICDFGFSKDQYGCDVCTCLPPPCQGKLCKETEVCETKSECIATQCRHSAMCSVRTAITRIIVRLNFAHEKPIDKEMVDKFIEKLKEKYQQMVDLEGTEIRNIQTLPEENLLRVTFHVVNEEDSDLVEAWQSVETHILNHATGSAITYNGQEFIPQHDSLVSLYSSSPDDEDTEGAGTNTILIVVIACAVAGAVIVIIAGVIAAAKSHKSKKQKKRGNKIYKKAVEENGEA